MKPTRTFVECKKGCCVNKLTDGGKKAKPNDGAKVRCPPELRPTYRSDHLQTRPDSAGGIGFREF